MMRTFLGTVLVVSVLGLASVLLRPPLTLDDSIVMPLESSGTTAWPSLLAPASIRSHTAHTAAASSSPSSSSPHPRPRAADVVVYALESVGCHDEVTAAFAFSFTRQPSVRFSIFAKAYRFEIESIYRPFFLPLASKSGPGDDARGLPFHSAAELSEDMLLNETVAVPDVLVLITCPKDFRRKSGALRYLLASTAVRLLCVVHTATLEEDGLVSAITPWVERQRITLVTLSPHVTRHLAGLISAWWNSTTAVRPPPIDTFVPVFPVGDLASAAGATATSTPSTYNEFAVQGIFRDVSRNYTRLFDEFIKMTRKTKMKAKVKAKTKASAADVTMHLLGSVLDELVVPAEIAERVRVSTSLPYAAYYGAIARSFALVPGFVSAFTFQVLKASSTMAASVITGCPLVANAELLKSYTYLDESVVWLRAEGEEEMDTVERVLRETDEAQRRAKSAALSRRREELFEQNARLVQAWLSPSLHKP